MKISEFRDKTDQELVDQEALMRTQLINMRIAIATSRPVSPGQFRLVKRDIARIKTIQTERLREAKANS